MILANFRIEPPGNAPSPLQNALNAWAVGLNTATFMASLASPYRLAEAHYRWNRTLAKAWGL